MLSTHQSSTATTITAITPTDTHAVSWCARTAPIVVESAPAPSATVQTIATARRTINPTATAVRCDIFEVDILLAPRLGHDLDLGLGYGRPLLGGGEAVLEGGDLGHQVTLGEEGDVEIGLSLGRGVDRALMLSIRSSFAADSAKS